ncbi:MAG: tetratricopeptide repeat protein, partial [Candidatus Methanofastidiosia archaeon]
LKELGDRYGEAKCYTNFGDIYYGLGDFKKALEYHERSLEIAEETGDKDGKLVCYTNLGNVYNDLGNLRKALEYLEESLKFAKETGNIDSERIINLALSQVYYESKPELAFDYCKRSLELSEMVRGNLVEEEHKIGFFTRVSFTYQYMVSLCLNLKKEKEAFNYTERSKFLL